MKIMPRHGLEIVGRDELVSFRDTILDIQNKVLTLIRESKKLDEVMIAKPTADYDSAWTSDPGWVSDDFIPLV